MNLESFYDKHYKKLLVVPLLLLALSVGYLIYFSAKNGDLFRKDVSLQGGVSATFYVDSEVPIEELQYYLENSLGSSDILVRKLAEVEGSKNGYVTEVSNIAFEPLKNALEEKFRVEFTDENFFVEETGSRVGEGFYKDMIRALVFSFVFMGIVIFIIYRTFVPSLAVIAAAFFDIVGTIAIINLFGMHVSSAGLAAIILLVGYSVDTDVLLTTRMLRRREGRIWERIRSSMATGLTMTLTTIAAMIVGILFSPSEIFKEMFTIILIGLVIDIIATYAMNAAILKLYLVKKYHEN